MTKKILKSVLPLTALIVANVVFAARMEPENTPDPRTREFEHISWAESYAGGTPKVLFIANSMSAWDVYATALRADMDYELFECDGAAQGGFAPKTDYYHEGIRLYPEAVAELDKLLDKDWDVIVFVEASPRILPEKLQYRVLEKIVGGTGAVTFNGGRWGTTWKYPGIESFQETEVLKTLPLSALSLARIPEEVDAEPIHNSVMMKESFTFQATPYEFMPIQAQRVGKGVVFDVKLSGGNYFGGPAIHPAAQQFPEDMIQSEYFFGLAAKLIYRAAGMRSETELSGLDADGKNFAPGEPITVEAGVSQPFTGRVRAVARTRWYEPVAETTLDLQNAETVAVSLPALPADEYFVDLWLLQGEKVVDWASAGITVESTQAEIRAVRLDRDSVDRELTGVVLLAGQPDGAVLDYSVVDGDGRIILQERDQAVTGQTMGFKLPLRRTRKMRHQLNVVLRRGETTVGKTSVAFFTPRPWEEDLFVYTDGEIRNFAGKRRADIFREYGITTCEMANSGRPPFLDLIMSSGLHPGYRMWMTHCHNITGGCISSDTYPRATQDTFEELAQRLAPYGLKFLSIGDDSGVARDFCANPPVWLRSYIVKLADLYDGDMYAYLTRHQLPRLWGTFHYMQRGATVVQVAGIDPTDEEKELMLQSWRENYSDIGAFNRAHGTAFASVETVELATLKTAQPPAACLLGFKDFLQDRYQTVAKLNDAWQTELASFSDVTGTMAETLAAEGKYGAKLDKTWYLESLFLKNIEATGKGVRKVSDDIGIGMGAASVGNIIPEVLERIDSIMPYKGDRDLEIIRSVPHRYSGQTIGVYGGKKVPESARVNQAWETVLTGGNFVWFWSMITGGLMGDLSTNPGRSGYMLDTLQEMQGGSAQALIRSERQHDGIAILHSRRSGAMSGLRKDLGTHPSSQVGFQRIIEDLGLQYRYTWTGEVESGVLRGDEFKVLILPYAQILSDKEVEEIGNFARRGGTVIADLRPATHAWSGKPLSTGQLDPLFGVRQNCAGADPIKGDAWIAEGNVPGLRGDAGVELNGGTAAAQLGDTPLAISNPVGDGQAVLLNFAPTTYNVLLGRNQGAPLRILFRDLLARAGVERRFKVLDGKGGDVAGAEIAVFRNGPIDYLTLEKKSYEFETYPINAVIELDAKYNVFNVRTGQSLGYTDKIPVALEGLGCYVFSLLPYDPGSLQLDVPGTAELGGEIPVSVDIGGKGAHTVRIDAFRPAGDANWPLIKCEARNGKAGTVIPIAFNDEVGEWRIVATDVTTGRRVEATVNVSKQPSPLQGAMK